MLDCITKGSLNILTKDKVDNISTQNLQGIESEPALLETDMYRHDGEAQFYIGLVDLPSSSNFNKIIHHFIVLFVIILIN